ncbi:rhodanese-like domain-containing protein [Desulfuromonas versatilis]|uniref:Rhodanese-like domain-containing protein n=1 Tax=Desulfuromonas versatilis TaxID=2802975 RepID=A0ABM8HN95_9BACT|nr:rhodanese-like domain-containing protein [Desulfuromonas versatilis]BCR04195.1 rhodanese-like domain-containing protein [Desulfuromonas versatilis]
MRGKFMISLLFLVATIGSAWAAQVGQVNSAESQKLLRQHPGLFLLDVRTPEEYREVRLEGARLIPIDQVVARLREIPFDRPVLVYCAIGSRSSQVADYLVRQGHPEVFNMTGGIWGWQLRGYPVLKGAP